MNFVGHKTYSHRQNYRKNKVGKCPGVPGHFPSGKKKIKVGFWCPGIFPRPGKTLSIIKVSMILSVTAKQEFSPFFAGIANYRKPAAVGTRPFFPTLELSIILSLTILGSTSQ